jgi:UDP-glucose 4-epimerase
MNTKNILITGGLGYVGGRLSTYFANLGHTVYSLSRSKSVVYKNITVLENNQVLKEGVLNEVNIDVIIHLASTNEVECGRDPITSNNVNINGTLDWLDWSVKNKVSQFIYFSTVHVYARPLEGHFTEQSACQPNHPYSITHKCAEDYVLWYRRDFNLNATVVRLSNSFGYPAFPTANRWTLFINDICKSIAESRKFEIRSNALQHRDFISLSEVCLAVNKLLTNETNTLENPIFNMSKGDSRSLLEIALLIREIAEAYYGEPIEMLYDEQKSRTAKAVKISNDKLKSIGWSTFDTMDNEEIRKTIEYFKINNKN